MSESLIDQMLALRDRLMAAADYPSEPEVLYYPPALVEKARIFWAGAYRVEPAPMMPTGDDDTPPPQ